MRSGCVDSPSPRTGSAGTLLFLVLLVLPGPSFAARGEGSSSALLARLPAGARSQAFGGMQGALPGSVEAWLANPAALGLMESIEAEAFYHQGITDVVYSGVVAAFPAVGGLVVGGAVENFSAGTIEAYDYVGTRTSARLRQSITADNVRLPAARANETSADRGFVLLV